MNAPAPASKPPMTSLPPTARETQRPVSAATPGQALSPDPADFAYHVRATAFNVLTGKMAGDERSVPRSERDAIARAVVDAVEPLIRADERAIAAQEPHAAPELPPHHPPEWAASAEETAYEAFTARRGTSRIAWETLDPAERADWRAVPRAIAKRDAAASAKPAPELAAYEADIASLTDQRNRVSETADQLRAVVAEILDAFGPSGSGHTARVGQVQIAKWRTRAGLTS